MHSFRAPWVVAAASFLLMACGTESSSDTSGEATTDASSEASGATGSGEAGSGSGEASGGSGETTGSTATTSGGSATTSGTTTSTGGGFVDVDMLGEAMCDIWTPGDCGDGEKCMPYASSGGTWDALKCSPLADNAKELGDECLADMGPAGGVDDCGAGLFCYYVNADTNVGTCIEFCTGSPSAPMCGPQTICTVVNDGVLVLCRPECDPVIQDCEPEGSACYQATGTGSFTCIADKSGNSGAYGDACEFISSCDAGLACLDATAVPGCTAGSCCTNFCDLTGPNTCPDAASGQQCEPYYDLPDPGYEHVGICAVPQPKVEGGSLGNVRRGGATLESVPPYM